jgi:hypothetical protein
MSTWFKRVIWIIGFIIWVYCLPTTMIKVAGLHKQTALLIVCFTNMFIITEVSFLCNRDLNAVHSNYRPGYRIMGRKTGDCSGRGEASNLHIVSVWFLATVPGVWTGSGEE